MTEFSMLWETQTGQGDGASSYTEEQATFFFKNFTTARDASMGVLSGIANELEVGGSATPLTVDTGEGVCYGFRYQNTASLNLAVATPAVGDTGGIVVLQANWGPTNTVRAVVRLNAVDGNPAIPALTQSAGTTWEIPLASFVIDTAGAIWADASKSVAGVSDARSFAITPLAGMIKLREFTGNGSVNTFPWNYIQQDLTSLLLVGHVISTRAATSDTVQLIFNNDAGLNYDDVVLTAAGGGAVASGQVASTNLLIASVAGSTGLANNADAFQVLIPNYANASLYKNLLARSAVRGAAAVPGDRVLRQYSGWWDNVAAITRIDLSMIGNFDTGTKITLYGIR